MMVLCYDIFIIEYDERGPELPNAPEVMEHDRLYQSKHNPYVFTYSVVKSLVLSVVGW